MQRLAKPILTGAMAIGAMLMVTAAQAAIVNDYTKVFQGDRPPPPGVNDCAGDLGTPPDCTWDGSPMIVKFDFNDTGGIISTTFGLFASITGAEFTFDFSSGFKWTYTPDDPTDPGVTAFSVKGGPSYAVWEKGSLAYLGIGDYSDTWTTWNDEIGGLSHIVFFDSSVPIPLPATAWLMLAGIGGLGLASRRRRAPIA